MVILWIWYGYPTVTARDSPFFGPILVLLWPQYGCSIDAVGVREGVVCIQCRRNGRSTGRAEPEYYSGAMDETGTMNGVRRDKTCGTEVSHVYHEQPWSRHGAAIDQL